MKFQKFYSEKYYTRVRQNSDGDYILFLGNKKNTQKMRALAQQKNTQRAKNLANIRSPLNEKRKFNGQNYRLTYITKSKREVNNYAKLMKSDDKNNRYRIVKKGSQYNFYERKERGKNNGKRKNKR